MIKKAAKEYLSYGLSVVPIAENKRPTMAWKPLQSEAMDPAAVDHNFSTAERIGIICGTVSGGLEVVDVDLKYDLTRKLWEELEQLLQDNLPEVYRRLVITQTISEGRHLFYRCSAIAGNTKLANRPTTQAERDATFMQEVAQGQTEEQAKRAAINDKERVLIETRGEGGYVVAPPSPGYAILQGDMASIPEISPAERDALLAICGSFDDMPEEAPRQEYQRAGGEASGDSPFSDYNERGDVVSLLERNGWKVVRNQGERILVKRPGATTSEQSGNFHTGKRKLMIWSSSTDFDPGRAHSPADVFIALECGGDKKEAARRLLEMGYGSRRSKTSGAMATQRIQVSEVNKVISEPGQIFRVEDLSGEMMDIDSPGPEAAEEVLKALDIANKAGKAVYVKEEGEEYRDYAYRLKILKERYARISEARELNDRDMDLLTRELVLIGGKIAHPVDRERYRLLVTTEEDLSALGITAESLEVAMDRIRITQQTEAQAAKLEEVLRGVSEKREQGDLTGAIRAMEAGLAEVRKENPHAALGDGLIKWDDMVAEVQRNGEGLDPGIQIGNTNILIPAAALTIIAAPSGHGKSLMLGNIAINLIEKYPDREFHYFTYEEGRAAVFRNILTTWAGVEVSATNHRSTVDHFIRGNDQYIANHVKEPFKARSEQFVKEIAEAGRLRIHSPGNDADTLVAHIAKIAKEGRAGAVLVDYIQMLTTPENKKNSRQEQLKEICKKLIEIAKETGIPLIFAAQFNRTVTHKLHLAMTNIREAGDIEHAANLIIGLWNNNMPATGISADDQKALNNKAMEDKGTIYALVLKHRNGKVGEEGTLAYNDRTGWIGNHKNQRNPLNP